MTPTSAEAALVSKLTKTRTTRSFVRHVHELPPIIEGAFNALKTLLGKLSQDPVFCARCREEVPDRKALCQKCQVIEEEKRLRIRTFERLSPSIKTLGSGIGMKEGKMVLYLVVQHDLVLKTAILHIHGVFTSENIAEQMKTFHVRMERERLEKLYKGQQWWQNVGDSFAVKPVELDRRNL